jgi:hypothetical protein
MELTVGADPEFFVRGKNGEYVSGHIFECGTKDKPMETDHGSVQVDGVALEVNVKPASGRDDFIRNIRAVLGDLRHVVDRVDPDVDIVAVPTVHFGLQRLRHLPEWVSALGCTPDFNAYTRRVNPRPDAELPFRTGSGHVHLGFTSNAQVRERSYFNRCCRIVRSLDYYLGLPSLLWDQDTERRQLYGQAGAFRPKPYGLEYRVLSNAWLNSDDLMGRVFEGTLRAYKDADADHGIAETYGDVAVSIINSNNQNWAQDFPEIARAVL